MKRLICLLLALVMVLSMIPMTAMPAFAEEYLIQEETIPEETIPEETIPEETIPEETVPEETIPEETLPEETIPEETIPEETVPEETIPEETIPEETIPEETIPEETIPEETVPEETIPTRGDTEVTVTASGTWGDNLTWVLTSDGVFTLSGNGNMKDIPTIGWPSWSKYNSLIKHLVVEEGVTSLARDAFYYSHGITSVSFPSSLTFLGYGAVDFYHIEDVYIVDPSAWCNINFRQSPMLEADTLHIIDENGEEVTEIVLDETVTAIPNYAFANCPTLKSVSIPDTVTSIGDYAFSCCSGLASISIPGSVTSIGGRAFLSCAGITSCTIEEGVTNIGDYAFAGCRGLPSMVVPESVTSIGQYAFRNCKKFTSLPTMNSITTITKGMFSGCSGLTDVQIPEHITRINSEAFADCTGLTSIAIPDGVTTIGSYAFSGCTGLTEIPDYNGITSIGAYTFRRCTSLTSVVIPAGISSIGNYAFADCTGLTSVTIPDSVTEIGGYAFSGCTGLTSLSIPESITSIGEYVFSGCTGLTSISIPESITSIGTYAFSNCSGLTSISIPNSVTTIGEYAFSGCTGITSITIPSGMKTISRYSFAGLRNLSSISIPETVTYIESGAFAGCAGLTMVVIPDTVKTLGFGMFSGCSKLETLTIPFVGSANKTQWETYRYSIGFLFGETSYTGGVQIGQYYYGESTTSTTYTRYYIPASLRSVTVTGGNIYRGAFYNCRMLTSITLPENLEIIEENAFAGCTGLTEMTIPDTVTQMPGSAFSSCSALATIRIGENNPAFCCDETGAVYNKDMTKLVRCIGTYSGVFNIPETVTSIDAHAFAGCKNVTGVHIPDSVTEIGGYAFSNCDGLTEVVVPESVSTVGEGAFYSCDNLVKATLSGNLGKQTFNGCAALKEVIMTNGVTSIGKEAFKGCGALKEIHFLGDAPSFDSNAFTYLNATIYYPAGNSTWKDVITKKFNGVVTWKARVNKGSCGDAVLWILDNNNTLTISGTGAMYDYAGGDQPWAEHVDFINDVVISKGVTSIGTNTFRGHGAIETVSIPETVTAIGAYAFGDAEIGKITFVGDAPAFDSNSFGNAAAYICYPSANATWESVVGNHFGGTLIWCPDGKAPTLPNPAVKEVIASGTFDENGKWEVYNDGVLKISATADTTMSFDTAPWYDYRTQIWEVDIGSGITALENGDLADLPLVTTVVIGPSVKSIGSKAFTGATRNLRFVMFEGDAPEINKDAFRGVTASVHFKTIYPAWEDAAYYDYRGSLNWIPHTSFSECGPDVLWFLEDDTLTITGLGDMYDFTGGDHPWNDFYDEIATVIVENGVTGIGDYTFAGLPAGVKIIFQGAGPSFGDNAFSGVTATAYYPVEKNNWTEDVMQQYGGTVTWVGYDKNSIPTFEKNEDVTYLSQTAAAEAINAHLLSRDTEFSIYTYQTFNASTTKTQLMKVGETLFTSAFGKTDGVNDWEYLDGHLLGYSYDLTYGHDTQKYYLNIHYTVSYLTTAEQEAKVDSKVKSILKSLDLKKASDYKKIEGIYNYLIKNVNYDNTVEDETDLIKYSAYGALVNKKANSHGFAVAFYRLAEELGLYANIIQGNLTGSLEYDAWNIVYLNGYYYCVDAAQDAIRYDAGKSKAYFLKGTGYFENHEPFEEYQEVYDKYCSPINYRSDAVLVGTCGDTVYWALLKDNTLRIMGEGEMKGNQGYRQYTEYVDKIVIEDGVTNIVAWAFDDFQYVKSIKIPDSVTKIGDYAFGWCKALKSIKIPNSVKTIGEHAFYYCKALTEVSIPGSVVSIGAYAFDGCTNIKKITLKEGLQTIGADAFSHTKISKITIPSTVTTIGESAFLHCKSLTSVTIPKNVTKLGSHAFYECSKLTTVKIKSEKLTEISQSCFSLCTKLTSITIPASVTKINNSAFEYCWKLTSVVIEGNVLTIADSAFEKCGMKALVFRGNAPEFVQRGAFVENSCTLYYPGDNETWTEEALARFSGSITKKEVPCTLGQVKNLKVSSVSDSTVKIAYSKVKNAAKYEIYVDGKLYDTTTSTSYTFKDLLGGQNYDVHVMAVKTSSGVLYCGPASQTIQVRPYYDLSKYKVTMEYNSVIYDGESKLPAITVQKSSSSEPLVQDTDYTVTYEDNAQIGTATVTITGINAYGGEIVKSFEILPDQVQNLQVEIASGTSVNLTFDSVPGATEYWIYQDGERVQKTTETSCTVTGLSAGKNNVFTVKAAAEAKGEDYTGVASEAVSAQPFYTVSLSQYEFAYTGSYQRPTVTVYGYNGEELTEGEDYTLSFKNNKYTGKAYVEIKGKGNYEGSVKEYYAINPAQVTGLKVSSTTKNSVKISFTKASSNSTKYYNVYVDGEKVGRTTSNSYTIKGLELGKTYSVYVVGEKTVSGTTYYGAPSEIIEVRPGTYIGGYKATLDFTKATFTGEEFKPAVTVKTSSKSSAKTLVQGEDYEVIYENNTAIGTAKVVITGIGEYAGTITKTFKINPPKVENVTAVAASNTSIEVSFDAAPGATSYWVYVNGERKAKITDTTCVIKGLKKNKTYTITVKAVATVDGENYTSDYTDPVSCKTVFTPAE